MREIRTSGLMSGERKRALLVPRLSSTLPVAAGLADRAVDWPWSSAQAHCTGHDPDDLLTFDHWQHLFGNPETIIAAWQTYLNGPIEEARRNATRIANMHTGSRLNRPKNWAYHASPPVSRSRPRHARPPPPASCSPPSPRLYSRR